MRVEATCLALGALWSLGCGAGGGRGPEPEMVSIPAGAFQMGCAPGDGDCLPYEGPLHQVSLSAYRIDKTEVTQIVWSACLSAGALDMAGNVAVWTADWFGADYYATSPGQGPTGPGEGDNRVIRGGSFTSTARYLRCSYRAQADPVYGYHDLGLRCCR